MLLPNINDDNASKNIDKRIKLNIGGTNFETYLSTLAKIQDTRLALLARLDTADSSWDEERDEFFFDRNPRAFGTILHYFRTAELHVDQSICGNVLKGELQFWGIEEQDIEACCWSEYSRFTEHKDALRELDDEFIQADNDDFEDKVVRFQKIRTTIWRFTEEPRSSKGAKVYAVVSMIFVIIAITVFVLGTHEFFQVVEVDNETISVIEYKLAEEMKRDLNLTNDGSGCQCCKTPKPIEIEDDNKTVHIAIKSLEYCCVVFFTLEFLIRFVVCPEKRKFFKSALNVIDLFCLVPPYLTLTRVAETMKVVMVLRVIRILRIFKLMKHYGAFKILVYTIKVSTRELLLMVVFLMSGVLMFGSLVHFVEEETFPNIPIGFWWALVTMTTVGYGDKYPKEVLGCVIGCLCVISGVLVIAFTVPIVVNNFSLYYSHAQSRIKLPSMKKKAKLKKSLMMNFFTNKNATSQLDNGQISKKQFDAAHKMGKLWRKKVKTARGKIAQKSLKCQSSTHLHSVIDIKKESNTPADLLIEDLDSVDSGISVHPSNIQFIEETHGKLTSVEKSQPTDENDVSSEDQKYLVFRNKTDSSIVLTNTDDAKF